MPSLVDQFCPNVHDAAISAASIDPESGAIATADRDGVVAVTRPGENTPGLVFTPGATITGAIALIRGGSLLAVGDDDGSVGVFRTDNGEPTFAESREGARGRVRAMRGIAISPEGSQLASIAIDGLIRVWDLIKGERVVAWQGFGGETVRFDARGERLLCLDDAGQPRLIDLRNREGLPMDRLQMPAKKAFFTRDGTYVVCAGQAGISILRTIDGVLTASFATRGGSGISNIVLSPDGRQCAAITQRSVHTFNLPDLSPVGSAHHGAPEPSGAAYWDMEGVRVGGSDGLLHGGQDAGVPPVTSVAGFGAWRIAVHQERLALWSEDQRIGFLESSGPIRESLIDREGRLIGIVPERGPVRVFSAESAQQIFDGGPETSGAQALAVGGNVVCALLAEGGVRWWDLQANQAFELQWPVQMALSGSGTWMGVVTPKGAVRVLDPKSGRDAIHPPIPLAEVPVARLAFVNRRPDLLVVDQDGVLGHYDLGAAARENRPGEGRDVLDFNVEIDRVWGITGGQYCALRLPSDDQCTILIVDIHACDVVHEVRGLHRWACVDAETGRILEPARSGALLERNMDGSERRVLRSLPGDEWMSFSDRGVNGASSNAAGVMR